MFLLSIMLSFLLSFQCEGAWWLPLTGLSWKMTTLTLNLMGLQQPFSLRLQLTYQCLTKLKQVESNLESMDQSFVFYIRTEFKQSCLT